MPKSRARRGAIPSPPRSPMAPGGAKSVQAAESGGRLPLSLTSAARAFPAAKPAAPSAADIKRANAADRHACDGAALIEQGRPLQAIPLLQRSIALNPRVAAAHHDLGVALLAAGRLELAAEAFSRALRLNPKLPSAHYNLAYALDGLGREGQALSSYEAAVELQPDLVLAQNRLGDLYLARRRNKDAKAAYLAVAVATAGTVAGQIAQARALDAAGAVAEALSAMRAIVEANPEDARARVALGRFLAQAGESADAAAQFERAATLSPDLQSAWYGVATNKKFTLADAPMLARINAALGRPNLKPSDRQAIHFTLGKAHDDMGRYEAAIRHVDAANKIRAASGALNREGLARRIDHIIATTPRGFAEGQPHPGVDDQTPILIVGMPRSGTTLVEQILSSHPQVAVAPEPQFAARRDTGPLPAPSDRHLPVDLQHELRDEHRLCGRARRSRVLLSPVRKTDGPLAGGPAARPVH